MISDEVYEEVVAELSDVRREWRRASQDAALAIERSRRAEAELAEARKELDIRTRELKQCREARRALEDAAASQSA